MTRFYIKGAPRFVNEFTNFKYRETENNLLMNTNIKNAILQNIEKMHSLLRNNLISVNEYMNILSNIEQYTIDKMTENDVISEYLEIFNNNTVNIHELTIHSTECNFDFDTFNGMLQFMRNEINFVNANR